MNMPPLPEDIYDLREDVDALVRWRESIEKRLYFLEDRLPDPRDRAEARRMNSFIQIEAFRGR